MQKITSLLEYGVKLRQTSPAEALIIFNQALLLSKEHTDEQLIVESTFNMAISYLNLANYSESLCYFNKTLEFDYTQNNLQLKAEVLRGIAAQYLRSYNYKDAIKYLYKAEQLSIETEHDKNLHSIYGSFGSLYNKLKFYELALEYTLKSLAIAKKLDDAEMIQYSFMSVGACYYHLNEIDKAKKYLNEALPGDNQFAVTNALHFLSVIKFDNKEYDLALKYSTRQIEISKKYNYYEYEGLGMRMVGDILFANGKFYEAQKYYLKGIEVLKSVGEKPVYFTLCRKLISVYEITGDAAKTNSLYKQLYEEHTLHLENEAQLNIERINIQHELEKIKSEAEEEKKINIRLHDALEKVKKLNDNLNELNREKNDFMNLVVHDLKNPLINILSLIRMMKDSAENEATRDYAENIISQTDRMFNLISRLLDYRAIEDGKLKIKNTVFKTEDILTDVMKNMNNQAEKKNLKMVCYNACIGKNLNTDYVILYQIMENLVSNAIKFSPRDKHITLNSYSTGDGVTFEVKDEGPGFTERDKRKVFSSFARLSAQPTGNEQSTGLGLSITKKLGTLISSRIELESIEGKGAKFSVTL